MNKSTYCTNCRCDYGRKEQANQQVDAQLTQGNQNIENAQSIDDVNTAKDNAVQAIDPIQASTDVKTNARAELLNEMQNKITEILNDNTTTNEEKGKDIGPVRAAYEEGLNNINVANSTGDVTTAKDAAVQKFNNFMQILLRNQQVKQN